MVTHTCHQTGLLNQMHASSMKAVNQNVEFGTIFGRWKSSSFFFGPSVRLKARSQLPEVRGI
jgi:hypothetical protein